MSTPEQERALRKQGYMNALSEHVARSHFDHYRTLPGVDRAWLLEQLPEVEQFANKEDFSAYTPEHEQGVRMTVERYKQLVDQSFPQEKEL